MQNISDNDLILYHYRDGIDAARLAEIEAALHASVELRARYTRLQQLLHEVDDARVAEPDDRFAERVWQRFDARVNSLLAEPVGMHRRRHWREVAFPARRPRAVFAAALALSLAIGVAFFVGRWSAPQPDEIAQNRANAMAARVLDSYVADHLRATEGLLLTAVNSDNPDLRAGNRELAASLVESNRLYALAAARSGNTRLADFLRRLEPVLLELANQPADAPVQSIDGLRDHLRKTDLLFQVRATQARIEAPGRHRI